MEEDLLRLLIRSPKALAVVVIDEIRAFYPRVSLS